MCNLSKKSNCKISKQVTKLETEVLKTNFKKEDHENGKFSKWLKCVIQEKWQDLKPHEVSLKTVKLVIW